MNILHTSEPKNILVIVAHPDDETLWCGGTMLLHPNHNWFVVCLCRGNDPDRAPKFRKALNSLHAEGCMGTLDDSPDQRPLDIPLVKKSIRKLLPAHEKFDLILTHSPNGEYTRHVRHEEIGRAMIELWEVQKIAAQELWTFAYEDGNRAYNPQAIEGASIYQQLPEGIWQEKYRVITEIYGFEKTGFEARTTPKQEAFWKFRNQTDARKWLEQEGMHQ